MADRWGGEDIQPLAAFETLDHDHVVRMQIGGAPVVIFGYRDQAPQVIVYPSSFAAISAFNQYLKNAERDDSEPPRTAGELRPGDEVTQRLPSGPVTHTVQRVVEQPVGVVEIWYSETFHWTVPVGEPVVARRPRRAEAGA